MREGTRVQIPAHTDAWMRGDKYGEVKSVTTRKGFPRDRSEVAKVAMDKSGKTLTFVLSDLREV